MLEQHEMQFTASAACRTETLSKKSKLNAQTGGSRLPFTTAIQKSQESVPTQTASPKLVCLSHVRRESGPI